MVLSEWKPEIEFLFEDGECFPECHASSLALLENGVILCVYFAGKHEKADDVGIFLSRHTQNGWEKPRLLSKVDGVPHWNPVIFEIPGGVRVCFKVGREIPDWLSWHTESFDQGRTWTKPAPYGNAVGPVRSKPIVLSNGKMLAPNSVETASSWRPFVDVSEDFGAHFKRLSTIPINFSRENEDNFISGLGAIQPTIWESEKGCVHALLRTTCGYIFRSDSADYGKTFSEAKNTSIPNNNSGIDAVNTPHGLFLAMNPVSGNWAARTPLVVLKSTDNGRTFSHFETLADLKFDEKGNKNAEFSYPAIIADEKYLHITFTWMRRQIAYAKIGLLK